MNNFINYDDITGLHLELTTKCNAACPMCNRNYKGKLRENLSMTELSFEDVKKVMNVDFIKKLKLISLCGVFGEPTCNSDLFEILNYIYSINKDVVINIYTNGSTHDEEWWKSLAQVHKNGSVVFGIDGLEGVSELHRRGTNFNKVIRNAKSYIDAGGSAKWDYIVFKHNEHQVKEAEALSKVLGFKDFQIKKTSRFFKNLYENDACLDSVILDYGSHPVYDCNGNFLYDIELPENKEYRNSSEDTIFEMINEYGSFNAYLNSVEIDCHSAKSNGIFISAFGEVYPCCTVYQQVCYGTIFGVKDPTELNEYNIYLKYNISGFNHSIKDIVEGEFFKEISDSFNINGIENGKCKSCSRTCARNINMHKSGHTKKDF